MTVRPNQRQHHSPMEGNACSLRWWKIAVRSFVLASLFLVTLTPANAAVQPLTHDGRTDIRPRVNSAGQVTWEGISGDSLAMLLRARAAAQHATFHEGHRRLRNPHIYPVGLT